MTALLLWICLFLASANWGEAGPACIAVFLFSYLSVSFICDEMQLWKCVALLCFQFKWVNYFLSTNDKLYFDLLDNRLGSSICVRLLLCILLDTL